MAKAYTSLETEFTKRNQEKKVDSTPAVEYEEKPELDAEGKPVLDADGKPVMEKVEKKATPPASESLPISEADFQKYSDEFAQTGALSEATYTALQKAGIPKATVDQYIAGQMAIAEKFQAAAFDSVGGKENYSTLITWAKANLSPAQQAAYNTSMESGDTSVITLAVQGLKASYEAVNGKAPNLIQGDGTPPAANGYQSREEMITAMSDPRYKQDPAYRQQVAMKLLVSKF